MHNSQFIYLFVFVFDQTMFGSESKNPDNAAKQIKIYHPYFLTVMPVHGIDMVANLAKNG